MIHNTFKLIIIATIACSASALDLTRLGNSQVSKYLMESRNIGGKQGCISFGKAVLHELGEINDAGETPKGKLSGNVIITDLFKALNRQQARETMNLSETLGNKLEAYVQQCLVFLGTYGKSQDIVEELKTKVEPVSDQVIEHDELDVSEDSEAPAEESEAETDNSVPESESEFAINSEESDSETVREAEVELPK